VSVFPYKHIIDIYLSYGDSNEIHKRTNPSHEGAVAEATMYEQTRHDTAKIYLGFTTYTRLLNHIFTDHKGSIFSERFLTIGILGGGRVQ